MALMWFGNVEGGSEEARFQKHGFVEALLGSEVCLWSEKGLVEVILGLEGCL